MFYSDNPYRDFDAYDSYLASLLDECPECDGRCGEKIQGDIYEIDGKEFCEDCFDDYCKKHYAKSVPEHDDYVYEYEDEVFSDDEWWEFVQENFRRRI